MTTWRFILSNCLAIITLSAPIFVGAAEWSGTVICITDGDTMTIINNQGRPIKVRLVEIDAPESRQPFGAKSKQSLSDICFNAPAVVDDKGTDRYKRTLGRVKCSGTDANAEQVRRGMAWAYLKYLTDQSIADIETVAKSANRGLWSDQNPVPPWEFRRMKH